jgi:hypothetical protein
MKNSRHSMIATSALIAGLTIASSAQADWTFTSTGSIADSGSSGISVGTTGAFAANGGTLTGGSIGGTIAAGSTYGISGFASGATWTVSSSGGVSGTGSSLAVYSGGLGQSSDSTGSNQPNHAIDNGVATNASDTISAVGNTEAVLLSFTKSVTLSSISIGYKFGDADISLFRYTGSATTAPALNGTGATSMASAGWTLVGNYGDLSTTATNAVNSTGAGSSWWLISAYNSVYGAATSGTVDQGNDYFKLSAVAGTACTSTVAGNSCNNPTGTSTSGNGVPEPTTLALVAIAGLGFVGARRRALKGSALA